MIRFDSLRGNRGLRTVRRYWKAGRFKGGLKEGALWDWEKGNNLLEKFVLKRKRRGTLYLRALGGEEFPKKRGGGGTSFRPWRFYHLLCGEGSLGGKGKKMGAGGISRQMEIRSNRYDSSHISLQGKRNPLEKKNQTRGGRGAPPGAF